MGERQDGEIIKGHEEYFGDDGYMHYLRCGDGFIRAYICQNLPSCTFLNVWFIIGHLNKA